MALDDYLESEVGIAVAVTAAVLSPPVRRVLRRGVVYGLAGIMFAGDAVTNFAQGVGRGVQQATATAAGAMQGTVEQVQTPESAPAVPEPATPAAAEKNPAKGLTAGAARTRTQTPPAKKGPDHE